MRIDGFVERLTWAPRAGARPHEGLTVLQYAAIVPASLQETFAFFADAATLERLTPPWLNFRIRTPMPVTMAEGLEIEYRIVLHGLPIPWRSRIDVWEPGVRFVDRQVLGPYRWWHHEHRFERAPQGTRVIDRVEFLPRLRWITRSLVHRDVQRIFAFRTQELARLFGH
jgi:ligand-binding SRPBCC domain-containing protein